MHFGSSWMFDDSYTNCNYIRSYITGVNKDSIAADNDFGDIVVADLNFDGRDDFALKQNAGGNAGPSYYFYIQDEKGRFTLDDFLTGSMGSFPSEIDAEYKKLITLGHAGAYAVGENTYTYNTKRKTWKMTRHRFITD